MISLAPLVHRLRGALHGRRSSQEGYPSLADAAWLCLLSACLRRHASLLVRRRRHRFVSGPALRGIAPLVRSSHENWDGSGYPDALTGEEIPLGSRIIRVCDAFTAMTARRPYREALTTEAALQELERGAGSQYDPTVTRVVVAHVRERLPQEQVSD